MARKLYQKLGILPHGNNFLFGYEGNYQLLLESEVSIATKLVTSLSLIPSNSDFIHIFSNDLPLLENNLKMLQSKLKPSGMIWWSWYKKASKKQGLVNEDVIRNTALAVKLVDVKVCSVNNEWSALKLVIPLKYRIYE